MDNMCFAWGTDDTDAIQKTLDVAKETGFAVYLPPGHFVVTKSLKYITDFVTERDEVISPSFCIPSNETWPKNVRRRNAGELSSQPNRDIELFQRINIHVLALQ